VPRPDGGTVVEEARAVVVIVIVELLPGVNDAGLNVAAAPAGKPAAVNVTVPEKVPPVDAAAIV
jgi:hypothetical protein